MTRTATKAELLALLQNLPDDAEIYVMATKEGAQRAVDATSNTSEKDVFMKIASTNILREVRGISLIVHVE